MQRCCGLLYLGAFAALSFAQSPPPAQAPVNSGGPSVKEVMDAARGTPPEFAADVLLTLMESGFVEDAKDQRKLIDEVLGLAGNAQEKVALQWTNTGPISRAFHLLYAARLDQISLRARAVRMLLKLDPVAGREEFERIDLPLDLKPTCEQPFWYRLTTYYAVMSEVLKSLPTPIAREQLIQSHLARLRSAAQVRPLADILFELSRAQSVDTASVVYPFAGRLTQLDRESRVFTSEFDVAITALRRLALAIPAGVREYLVEQSRVWVLQAVGHGICTQHAYLVMSMDGTKSRREPVAPIDAFNTELAPLGRTKPVIEARNINAPLPGLPFERETYSADYMRFDQMRRLLAQDSGEAKQSVRWKNEIDKYIGLVVDWKNPTSEDKDPTAFYLEKAELLHQVLAIQNEPPGPWPDKEHWNDYWSARRKAPKAQFMGRDRVILELADLFESKAATAVYNRRRCVWFQPVRELIASRENSPDLDGLLAGSKDPVLHLYGLLAQLMTAAGKTYI
jgi:hypothetical protein